MLVGDTDGGGGFGRSWVRHPGEETGHQDCQREAPEQERARGSERGGAGAVCDGRSCHLPAAGGGAVRQPGGAGVRVSGEKKRGSRGL